MNKNADVLFVYTNIYGDHSDTYSYGIGYISSVLKEKGLQPLLVIVRSVKDYKKVISAVLKYRPKIIGFTSVSSQFVFVRELAKLIRKKHKCIIVAGGVHPTIFPECLINNSYLDGIFIGESEFTFLEFASRVLSGSVYNGVDNFCYLNAGQLIRNKIRPQIDNLDTIPFPDRDIYNYQEIIDENNKEATIITSRGCPFHCTYCSNHAIARVYGQDKNIIRYHSVERSLAEIEALRSKYDFEQLYFIDDLFILNRNRLEDFLVGYKKRFRIPFMCQVRPNFCTRDIMFKLKDAGCYRIFVAIESANDYIRNKVMKRNISKTQIEDTFNLAKEAGIETLSVNIIGVPHETEETILETIDFNRKMSPSMVGVNIFSPYEGTELGDYCQEHGLLKDYNLRNFRDRRKSRLILSGIKRRKLMYLYDRFEFLIYKDINYQKARILFWKKRYRRLLEDSIFCGPLLRGLKRLKITRSLGKLIFKRHNA